MLEVKGLSKSYGSHQALHAVDLITTSESRVRIETNDTEAATAAILAALDMHAAELRGLTVFPPSLEMAFLHLTEEPHGHPFREIDADVA